MTKTLLLHKGNLAIQTAQGLYGSVAKITNLAQYTTLELKSLYYDSSGKTKADTKKEWLKVVKEELNQYDYLLVADSDYFKLLTKEAKADSNLGIIKSSEYTTAKILYLPPTFQAKYDLAKFKEKVRITFNSLISHSLGSYKEIGSDIIHSEEYPLTASEIALALKKLHSYPELAMDIEAQSLKVTEAGIYTIGFAWDKHNGIVFPVDASSEPSKIRELLKEFLDSYKGKLIVHKANYDILVLVYNLYMNQDFTNLLGQVNGIKSLCKNLDDTLLITYLATNSCAGNTLTLKDLAQPFAGNWAVDVTDVTKIDLPTLLRYNLIDCLSTIYVKDKYYPIMVQDNQEELYKEQFLPYLQDCIRMQLNGLPINVDKVLKLEQELIKEREQLLSQIINLPPIKNTEYINSSLIATKKNEEYKKKRVTWEDVYEPINFNSNKQLEILLYQVMRLPVIETTPSGNPSVSGSTIKKLINHTSDTQYQLILNTLKQYSDVEKILSAFIPAFKHPSTDIHGNQRLTGYMNLGGTVSGRMSSNNPNLQNLPATGSRFAKPVKECFTSNNEWIMCGIDFNALESRIDALTTKDPNKLKVFSEGWDSHCLNAVISFGSKMPDIDPTNKESVNSIKDKYPEYRQKAKSIGFALQYGGEATTLIRNSGLDAQLANEIYENYHTAYSASLEWKKEHIKFASINGYVTGAFGLRVRTPMLIGAGSKLTNLQAAESRTAGNALGQGWGLLNNRAMNAVLKRVDEAGLTESIYPIAAIHDASYYMVKNDAEIITWFNKVVTEEARWQNHPDIAHPLVGLEGQLDLYFPSWATPLTLPENLNQEELINLCINHIKE